MAKTKSVFIAYRHTGEDPDDLRPMLEGAAKALSSVGADSYCTFLNEDSFKGRGLGAREIMEHAFEEIQRRDVLLVLQRRAEKSEGMLMEVGRFYGVKPIVVATHEDVGSTYVPEMADVSFEWNTQEELEAGCLRAISELDAQITD